MDMLVLVADRRNMYFSIHTGTNQNFRLHGSYSLLNHLLQYVILSFTRSTNLNSHLHMFEGSESFTC